MVCGFVFGAFQEGRASGFRGRRVACRRQSGGVVCRVGRRGDSGILEVKGRQEGVKGNRKDEEKGKSRRRMSEETKERISLAMQGRKQSEETRERIAAAMKGRRKSSETKERIAASMMGKSRSESMKEKISTANKGRVPWNKGKSLTSETKKRMSLKRTGRSPWNKGIQLSASHRQKISAKMTGRTVSESTRQKLKMARRRPGDNIISRSRSNDAEEEGNFSLVDTDRIHEFVSLRRDLRIWSDTFADRVGRRPSISDVRRIAPIDVAEKFEQYLKIRDKIRGLAKDVYGSVDPKEIPVVGPRKGEPRVIRVEKRSPGGIVQAMSAEDDNETQKTLSKRDYRILGQYRLMESNDMHTFIQLRRELKKFSDKFKEREGRIPALSDVKDQGSTLLYEKFERYLKMRDRMYGLVNEVYGIDVDNLEEMEQVSKQGQLILEQLRHTETDPDNQEDLHDPMSADFREMTEQLGIEM